MKAAVQLALNAVLFPQPVSPVISVPSAVMLELKYRKEGEAHSLTSTKSNVRVPHAGGSLLVTWVVDVPLKDDCTWSLREGQNSES